MSELRPEPKPPRSDLLRSIGAHLHQIVPGFRPIAGDLLADHSRIDLFGVDAEGRGVLALLGEREEDALLLLGRVLAQRAWVQARLADWRKLAPELPVRPDSPVYGVLLCPGFGSEARAAAAALPPGAVRLVSWRYVRNGAGADALLEAVGSAAPPPARLPANPEPRRAPATGSGFRTGLTDQDLGLSDAERAEFE